MRARVVLLSAAANGALFAWLAHHAVSHQLLRPRHTPPPSPSAPPPIPADPIAVTILDEPIASGAPSAHGGSAPRDHAAATAHIASTATTTTPGPKTAPPGGTPDGASRMHMRAPDLALSPETLARIADARGGTASPADESTKAGRRESVSGGGAILRARVATLYVHTDGTARFKDKPDIDLKWRLPIPHFDLEETRKQFGKELTEWFADPYAGTRFGRVQDVARHITAVEGACDQWGDVWCDDPLAPGSEKKAREDAKAVGGIGLGGTADISSWLHRKLVGDPYASRKLKLLDDTRAVRVLMGGVYRAPQRARSGELIARNLQRLWAEVPDAAARREALFAMWDECAEGEGPSGEAGDRARVMVIGWIRGKLPAGSPEAFSISAASSCFTAWLLPDRKSLASRTRVV